MKTYKEMTDSLLRRREEYEMKRRRGDRIRMTVAGALAVLMIINVMIFAPVIARKSKGPDAAPIAEQTTVAPDNVTSDAITDGTTEENDETTQTEITDVTLEPENTQFAYIREYDDQKYDQSTYVPEFELVEDNEHMQKFEVVFSSDKYFSHNSGRLLFVSETEKIKTYKIRYNDRVYHNWEFYDYETRPESPDHVKILIRNDNNVKMISPEIMVLDLVNGSAEFDLTFEYTDITNALFHFYVNLPIDDAKEIPEYDPYFDSHRSLCSVATVKNKDFFTWTLNTGTYRFASIYFEDIDEDGRPLYEKDPYLPDYYDDPWCKEKRNVPHVIVERNDTNYGFYNGSGQTRSNEIMVCGYINWTASDNSLHPARKMTVYVIDRSDPNNRHETLTDDTGYYVIQYPVSSM